MDNGNHQPFDNYLFDLRLNKYPNQTHYYYFNHGFSPEECRRIVNDFKDGCTDSATVFGGNTTASRKTKVLWLPRNPTTTWIYDRVVNMGAMANEAMFGFDLTGLRDSIQFALYDSDNGGKYDTHIDMGSSDLYACRKLSMTVQLSDPSDYDGGDVVFREEHALPRDQGAVSVFSSFSPHSVAPVTRGERYSLVLWIYGPPFK